VSGAGMAIGMPGTQLTNACFPRPRRCGYVGRGIAIREPVSAKGLHGIGPVHIPKHRDQAKYDLVTGLLNAAIPRLSLASAMSRKAPS